MSRFLLLLAAGVGLFTMPITAKAQQTPFFSRPIVTVRLGAVQGMQEGSPGGETGGPVPYLEGQSIGHLGKTPFGVALYSGLSYERWDPSVEIVCISPPCFGPAPERYLALVAGVRFGVFPRHGPIDIFVGLAPHLLRGATESERVEDERWFHYFTVEGGVHVGIPVSSRFGIEGGVLGFLPVDGEEGIIDYGWRDLDLRRFGFQVGVQYEL